MGDFTKRLQLFSWTYLGDDDFKKTKTKKIN